MKEYIEREAAIAEFQHRLDSKGDAWISSPIEMAQRAMRVADMKIIRNIPAADVVPWEWLELYADYFLAGVSMPEFVREAKMFYESSNKAMQGGVIDG